MFKPHYFIRSFSLHFILFLENSFFHTHPLSLSRHNSHTVGGQIFAKIQALVVVEESRGGGGGSGVCGDVFASFLEFVCGGGI